MSVPISQDRILVKCQRYFEMQSDLQSSKYQSNDIADLLKQFQRGKCSGLVSLWLIRRIDDDETIILSTLKEISNWDESVKSLKEGDGFLEKLFEQFINDLRFAHQVENSFISGITKHITAPKLPEIYNFIKPINSEALCLEFSFPFIFKRNELLFTLKTCILEDRMIYLNNQDHAVGVVKKGEKYFVYDPNNDNGEIAFNDIASLERFVEEAFFDSTSKTRNMPVSIKAYRKGESKYPARYPILKKLLSGIIDVGNEIDRKSEDGRTPLTFAAYRNDIDTVKSLIELGANVHVPFSNESKETLLHYSIKGKNIELTKILLDKKVDVNVRDDFNATPLYYAVQNGDLETVILLLAAGAKPIKISGVSILHKAILNNDINIVNALVAAGADVNEVLPLEYSFLQSALLEHRFELAKILIAGGANINIKNPDGLTLLQEAVLRGNLETVKLLIKSKHISEEDLTKGIEISHFHNAHEMTKTLQSSLLAIKFATALLNGDSKFISEFINHPDIDPNNTVILNTSPLLWVLNNSSNKNQKSILDALLSCDRVDLNCTDLQGNTPLMLIAMQKVNADFSMEVLHKLLRHKVNLDAQNKDGNTALMHAVEQNFLGAVNVLLENGANLQLKNNQDLNVLEIAVEQKSKPVSSFVLSFLEESEILELQKCDAQNKNEILDKIKEKQLELDTVQKKKNSP